VKTIGSILGTQWCSDRLSASWSRGRGFDSQPSHRLASPLVEFQWALCSCSLKPQIDFCGDCDNNNPKRAFQHGSCIEKRYKILIMITTTCKWISKWVNLERWHRFGRYKCSNTSTGVKVTANLRIGQELGIWHYLSDRNGKSMTHHIKLGIK
jgi:hypothetical protein